MYFVFVKPIYLQIKAKEYPPNRYELRHSFSIRERFAFNNTLT